MHKITVSELYCYPVKSCRGIPLQQAVVGAMGIEHDRQWMFVDQNGNFVAQRGYPKIGAKGVKSMCLIETKITGGSLILSAPNMPEIALPLTEKKAILRPVVIWDVESYAVDQGDYVAQWATEYLSRELPGEYRMVRMPNDVHRQSRAGQGRLAFADAYPFLVIAGASLSDLNSHMEVPLPMNRFRPNVVLSGCEAYFEDTMSDCKIGSVDFIGMNLCVRCPITTTNQLTGERGKEPLRTLATYRKTADGVVFGRNFNHSGTGIISVNDPLIF